MSRALAMLARQRLLPQGLLAGARRWLTGAMWMDHPQLAAVIHSGDGEAPAAGITSRDLAAVALYAAGLLRPPASVTDENDPAKATGVLLVEARAPRGIRIHSEPQQDSLQRAGQRDTEGDETEADLRHWTLGGASWILLDNSSEENVAKSADYLRRILAKRLAAHGGGSGSGSHGGGGDPAETTKRTRSSADVAAAVAYDAKKFLQHSEPPPLPPEDVGAPPSGEEGRRVLSSGKISVPTVVVAHLPLFTQYCGGSDTKAEW
jgi:hypothetical protein